MPNRRLLSAVIRRLCYALWDISQFWSVQVCCHLINIDSEDVTMEEYWRELAEQRRLALQETLFENEEVCNECKLHCLFVVYKHCVSKL